MTIATTTTAATIRFGVTKLPASRGSAPGIPAHEVEPGSTEVM